MALEMKCVCKLYEEDSQEITSNYRFLTLEEAVAIASDLLKKMEVGTKDHFKLTDAAFEFWPARCSGTALLEKMARNPPKFFLFEIQPDGQVAMVTPLIR